MSAFVDEHEHGIFHVLALLGLACFALGVLV